MSSGSLKRIVPSWKNVLLAVLASVLLILAFPDFEYCFLAWFALVPLMWAVEREKASTFKSFVLGWIFGTIFFSGTCWWLTYAPINYAGFPPLLAYFLLFCVTAITGLFPGIFAAILSVLLRRFGSWAFLAAPFVWVFTEFLRYWLTGNSWNAIGYSQAFTLVGLMPLASVGGACLISFGLLWTNSVIGMTILIRINRRAKGVLVFTTILCLSFCFGFQIFGTSKNLSYDAAIIAVQPNVPMAGVTSEIGRAHV